MNINELDSYNLADAVKFHRRLNPRLWGRDEHLLPEVREKLLAIAADFQEFLGVDDLDVQDITISGSNAAYSYTKNSDIDLHLVVEMPDDPVYQELFTAKKYQYNDEHNIKIGGADVELYVQPSDQTHHSQGIYSIKNNKWISVPQRKRAQVDDACVRDKTADLDARIHAAVKSKNIDAMSALWDKIKAMRKSGLEQHGEFGCENIAFKMLRNSGCIKLLKDAITAAQDHELSLREAPRQKFRYGFSEGHQGQPYSSEDGVAASTCMYLNEDDDTETRVRDFIQHVTSELGIDPLPEIVLHTDPAWSTHNHSFGRYDPDTHTLNVSMPNRHILDVLRTVAHELVHCSQNQQHGQLPDDAGETGSRWENDANARAGIIMRNWANLHPEDFEQAPLEEGASGYIPKNKKEAAKPQYAMALSVDVHPGQTGTEANKLALKTGRNGEPGLLQPDAQNLLREFAEFVAEQENLFEITMSPSSLRKLSAQTGALAGMEFEMIVPGVKGEDQDQEPDYDYDESANNIDDICNFFYDGDFNSRRQIDDLRQRLRDSYEQWADDQVNDDWVDQGMDFLYRYVKNNVDDETIIEALGLESDEEGNDPVIGVEQWAEYAQRCWEENNDTYDEALSEFRDDWFNDSDKEENWLESEDLERMSDVESRYGSIVTWPHWSDPDAGETDVEQVADEFSNAIGREVRASKDYHSRSVERPSTRSAHYIVEPDGSLDPDDSDDAGLEFVSPPLPIEELLSDLNKVKAWADRTGCYTNDSTGLHINVSVPGWTGSTDQLDYVKLALLLGDEFVLDSFGRAGNTYAKSAMGKIRSIVKQNPNSAQELMDKMKSGMDQLASKVIHSRSTEKYTSINVKNGYIEFRSPGGDWLNDNFKEIDNTLRRFTVALSAAVDPEAYREEYLKKLYKLLDVSNEKDPLSYFAKFAAGELPKAALKSFVRQAQLERGVKRGKETGPMWWKVYKEGKNAANGAVIEVVASSREEALDKAAQEWGVFSNEYRRAMYAEPLRPYDGVDTSREYELYDRRSGAVVATFRASDDDAALAKLDQFRAGQVRTQGITVPQANEIYGVRSGGAVRTPPSESNTGNWGVWVPALGRFSTVAGSSSIRRFADRAAAQAWIEDYNTRHVGSELELIAQEIEPAAQQPHPEGRGRPNNPNGRYAIVARSDQAAYGRTGGPAPAYQFRFDMENLEQQGYGRGVLQAWAARNSVDPANYIVVDTTQYADQIPTIDIDVEPAPAPQQPGMGQWNGQWKVLVGGQEVYRFGGVGNSQADANRIAAQWLRTNGQGVSGEGFEVYPVMDESLHEYAMPQPSHGPGKYRDLNEPLGPETPPEMPDGTIKVDVSDMYDWYKLGQKISDLGSIKSGELGQGPPSTVFAFGSEDLENMYSHELTRLGLKTHDLDEPGETDIDESAVQSKKKLDDVLARCCAMIEKGQHQDPERYGMVAACVIDPKHNYVYGINLPGPNGTRRHAERVAIDKYIKQHGDIPPGSIVVTTLSPCNSPMDERAGESCKDLLNSVGIRRVYCGYVDPTQHDDADANFAVELTQNDDLWESCKAFADTFLHEGDIDEGAVDWAKRGIAGAAIAAGTMGGAHGMGAEWTERPDGSIVKSIKQAGDAVKRALPSFTKQDTVQQAEPGMSLLSRNNPEAEEVLHTTAVKAGLRGAELAQFLAQTRHESADFAHMKEIGSKQQFAKYEAPHKARQLGNKVKGDGERFKGRGFIQLTGRDNYTRASEQIFGNDALVRNPDLASRPDVAAKIALWYWTTTVRPNVKNFNDTTAVTRAINPAMRGLQDRHANFKQYMAVL